MARERQRNSENTERKDLNEIKVSGIVTFVKASEKLTTFGVKVSNGKQFACVTVKAFTTDKTEDDLVDRIDKIEKGSDVSVLAHFSQTKYNDKFYLDIICDDVNFNN